jgi:hypothetical protein
MQSRESILNYFRSVIDKNILGSSYLFIGKEYPLVYELLFLIGCGHDKGFSDDCWDCRQMISGNHPDVFVVKPEGFTIKIDSIRRSIGFLSLKSYSLKRKILIIEDAHALSPQAANAFLKTLEEPSKNSFIAVCSGQVEDLLPTIVSRCRKIFLPVDQENLPCFDLTALEGFLSGGNIKFKDRQEFSSFLWSLILLLQEYLKGILAVGNNRLLDFGKCEIILNRYKPLKIQAIIDEALKVYGDCKTINMNLALNLIRVQL